MPWDKELAVAALESGADAVVVDATDTATVKTLGRITVVSANGDIVPDHDVFLMDIASKADEERAAQAPREATLILRMKDWTIIPLENLLAQRDRVMAIARSTNEARTLMGILEKGVDGVVVDCRDPADVRRIVTMVHGLSQTLTLQSALITRVEPSGMGDRVCIDTCSNMTAGEGMLVGNTSNAFFLVQAETLENPYVAARPFRVNASAVHAYLVRPDDKTSYLSDLRVGDPVLAVNWKGETRRLHIGRCKVEMRPMILIHAETEGRTISIYLQNAETINLVGVDGRPISVSALKPGDSVLVHTEEGGRHFGMKIKETLIER